MLHDVTTVAESEVLLVTGDLNSHTGEDRRGVKEVRGAHGFGVRIRRRKDTGTMPM